MMVLVRVAGLIKTIILIVLLALIVGVLLGRKTVEPAPDFNVPTPGATTSACQLGSDPASCVMR